MLRDDFLAIGEYAAAGYYEEEQRSLFYRKSLALRRFFEKCELAPYNGEKLYPCGVIPQKMRIVPDTFWGVRYFPEKAALDLPSLSSRAEADFCPGEYSSVPPEHTVAGNMYTHSMPNYERVLKEGLLSYTVRIQKIADVDMKEGLLHLVAGLRCYVERCVEYLTSVSADEALIAALKKVPLYPATNVYEAIVSWNFLLYLDNCDNLGCLSMGLSPYFHGEDVEALLACLYDNIEANDGYSLSLLPEAPDPLTVQCLRAAKGKRRPMIELFVDERTSSDVWQAAFETVKSGGGQPAFYHATALFQGLKERFPTIRDEDFAHFCGGGCTESMICGYSCVGSIDAGINLLLILEEALYAALPCAKSFEEFYEEYLRRVADVVEQVKREICNSRLDRAHRNPLPMRTLLIDDCIDNGTDYNQGGARYNWSIINFAGLINVIDSLLNVKELIFEKGKYTAEQMLARLKQNDADFLREMIAQPKSFGKDIDEVNLFAHEFSRAIFSMTDHGDVCFGEGFLSASIQFMSQAEAGKGIGATPDGREAGAPLCDSLAAIFGKDSLGPTALLNSVAALDLKGALGTPVLNFNVMQKIDDEILKCLILGYLEQGGLQLQLTYASREELLDAYEHPERHGNLIVRVGGYSEYFVRLSDELKRMVINRTIQDLKPSAFHN